MYYVYCTSYHCKILYEILHFGFVNSVTKKLSSFIALEMLMMVLTLSIQKNEIFMTRTSCVKIPSIH
jgi:hypothetical protein